eukprot:355053-Chlamydomonas_euryale.AAC.2
MTVADHHAQLLIACMWLACTSKVPPLPLSCPLSPEAEGSASSGRHAHMHQCHATPSERLGERRRDREHRSEYIAAAALPLLLHAMACNEDPLGSVFVIGCTHLKLRQALSHTTKLSCVTPAAALLSHRRSATMPVRTSIWSAAADHESCRRCTRGAIVIRTAGRRASPPPPAARFAADARVWGRPRRRRLLRSLAVQHTFFSRPAIALPNPAASRDAPLWDEATLRARTPHLLSTHHPGSHLMVVLAHRSAH